MTWEAVARKEFQDSIRSYWLLGLTAIFTVLVAGAAGVSGVLAPEPTSSSVLLGLNGILITSIVSLLGLVIGFAAVAGERESGSLKLMLSLPHARTDVVVGKAAGRGGALAAAIAAGFLLPGLVLAATTPFDAVEYLGYILFVALLGVVFVAIGVAISANAKSHRRANAAMLAFYFVFVVLWGMLQIGGLLVFALLLNSRWPEWMPFTVQDMLFGMKVFNPTGSFKLLTKAFLHDGLFAAEAASAQSIPQPSTQMLALFMLLFWIVVPLTLGMWRFDRADL